MTSETIMQVLKMHPDARCIFCEKSDVWCVVKTHLGETIGEGDTQPEAWDDAASRLTASKLPSSPAGEMGCETTLGTCDNLSVMAPGHWPFTPHKKTAECYNFKPVASTALGADISGPKGSGGAAELKPCPFCGSNAYFHGDPNGGHAVSCRSSFCGTFISGTPIHPAVPKWNTRAEPAAPIAPAAQELVYIVVRNGDWTEDMNGTPVTANRVKLYGAWSTRKEAERFLEALDSERVPEWGVCIAWIEEVQLIARAERKEGEAKNG